MKLMQKEGSGPRSAVSNKMKKKNERSLRFGWIEGSFRGQKNYNPRDLLKSWRIRYNEGLIQIL